MNNLKAVDKVIMFGFNYNHNFIEECWGDSNITNHLQSKFLGIYDKVGSNAVFNIFYSQLDSENKEKLINYILNN